MLPGCARAFYEGTSRVTAGEPTQRITSSRPSPPAISQRSYFEISLLQKPNRTNQKLNPNNLKKLGFGFGFGLGLGL